MKQILLILILLNFFQLSTAQDSLKKEIITRKVNSDLKKINEYLNNEYNNSVSNSLNTFGYFDYTLKKTDTIKNTIFFDVRLNEKTESIKLVIEDYEILNTRKTENIKVENIETFIKSKSQTLINKGIIFNELYLKDIKENSGGFLSADLKIGKKSDVRKITQVIIKGYDNFPQSFLKHKLRIKKNQVLNLEDLKNKSKLTKNLKFVDEIKPPEVLFKKDSSDVYLYLKKNNANTFDGFIGFANSEESDKIQLNGYINLNLINNLNYGEELNLTYNNNQGQQKNFELNIKIPYILNSPIGTELDLNIFTQDSLFTNTKIKTSINYTFKGNNEIVLGYETNTSVNLIDEEVSFITLQDYESRFMLFGLRKKTINKNNPIFNLTNNISLNYKTGSRTTENKKINQNDISIKANNSFYLNSKNCINLGLTGKKLFSKNYLTNELYRFGGIRDIRGFNDNSLEATTIGILNLEYHYLLAQTISINTITDFGYFENELLTQKRQLYGFGLGINAKTKAGLLNLTFANGILKDEPFKFKNTKLNLSIKTVF